jgi:hypothetical protein
VERIEMMKDNKFNGRLGLAPELWTARFSEKEDVGFNL